MQRGCPPLIQTSHHDKRCEHGIRKHDRTTRLGCERDCCPEQDEQQREDRRALRIHRERNHLADQTADFTVVRRNGENVALLHATDQVWQCRDGRNQEHKHECADNPWRQETAGPHAGTQRGADRDRKYHCGEHL